MVQNEYRGCRLGSGARVGRNICYDRNDNRGWQFVTGYPQSTKRRWTDRRRVIHLLTGGLAWILPGFIISVGIIYYSIFYAGYLSFFEWGGGRRPMIPVGAKNY